mgnify:CR=1 FL=1
MKKTKLKRKRPAAPYGRAEYERRRIIGGNVERCREKFDTRKAGIWYDNLKCNKFTDGGRIYAWDETGDDEGYASGKAASEDIKKGTADSAEGEFVELPKRDENLL